MNKPIPKKIHFCWFGGDLPQKHAIQIAQWKKIMPDFEFKLWTENEIPENEYLKTAKSIGNWANMSNFTRIYALSTEGGIYMDTDFHVAKDFKPLLSSNMFLGFETGADNEVISINNAIMGAMKSHPIINEMLEDFLVTFDGTEIANLSSPVFTTKFFRRKGLTEYKHQTLEGVEIYPINYFYPYPLSVSYSDDFRTYITSETYAVHLWEKSWKDEFSYFWIGQFNTGVKKIILSLLKKPIKPVSYYRDFLWHLRMRLFNKNYYKNK